ncbi:hypothetical protein BKA64DRAFT_337253 [Cadophora sp. MPI-SDFR-AT-0126]|nr:hypothetical protein BKA64DRAFT_337253 [Leotiomycetes sp. MPI-SDFR-AT-0126]
MANVSILSGRNEKFSEMLGPDILLLVFENLSECSSEFLQSLRLVSRSFNCFATPVRYRSITLSHKLLDPNTDGVNAAWEKVHNHTQHVNIKTTFDWDIVVHLLSGCSRLKSMTWSVLYDNSSDGFPRTLSQAIHDYWPHVRLNVARIDCPLNHRAAYPGEYFPALNIIDILVDNMNIPSITEPVQALLVASKNLESLRIGMLRHPFVPHVGKLPAVRKLVLAPLIWDYSPEESLLVWDFSRLEAFHVQLETLHSLAPLAEAYGLTRLTRLNVNFQWANLSHGEDSDAEYHEECTVVLRRIIERIPHQQLRELEVTCCLSHLPITSIVRHGKSLRNLSLLDVSGFEADGIDPVTTSMFDLQILHAACARLVSLALSVDFDGVVNGSCRSLDILSGLRNLRNLTLYSKCLLGTPLSDTTDVIRSSAYEIMRYLCDRKQGLPLHSLGMITRGWSPFRGGASPWAEISENDRQDPVRYPQLLLQFTWDSSGSFKYAVSDIPNGRISRINERKIISDW